MKALALTAPIAVLGLLQLLQRLEVWALQEDVRGVSQKPAPSPLDTLPTPTPLRQRDVPDRHAAEEVSSHG